MLFRSAAVEFKNVVQWITVACLYKSFLQTFQIYSECVYFVVVADKEQQTSLQNMHLIHRLD